MIIITAALPYGNNCIHIGHIFSTFLPADICARVYRELKHKVNFISGMDSYGTPILLSAFEANVHPQTILDKYYKIDKNILELFSISLDNFNTTVNDIHHKNVNARLINKKSQIFENTEINNYCDLHDIFLNDRLLSKYCEICKQYFYEHEEACEHNKVDYCSLCIKTNTYNIVSKLNTIHYNLKFDIEKFHNLIKFTQLNKVAKDQVENINLNIANSNKVITRYSNWGVPCPNEINNKKYSNLVIYVWVEALMFYSSFSDWDNKTEYKIQFMGKDNVFFHTYMQPNIIDVLPDNIVASHFLKYNGKKISKRDGNNLDLTQLSKEDCDCLRLYLCSIYSNKQDTNFNLDTFYLFKEQIIVKKIYNIFQRIIVLFIKKNTNQCEYQNISLLNLEKFYDSAKCGELQLLYEYIIDIANDFHKTFDQQKLWLLEDIKQEDYTEWLNKLLQYKKILNIIFPYTINAYLDSWLNIKDNKIYINKYSTNIFNL